MPCLKLEDPESILDFLAPVVRDIYDALDAGIALADQKCSDIPYDPHLWAHLARFGARVRLESMVPDGWAMPRRLPHSGIELVKVPLVLRVLKAQGDCPPHPGTSQAKRLFWSQQAPRLPLEFGNVVMPQVANLLLDWTAGDDRRPILALSKPSGTWRYQQSPQVEWRLAVGVSDQFGVPTFVPSAEDDIQIAPVFDPIELDVMGGTL